MKTNKVQPFNDMKEESNQNNSELPSIDGHLLKRNFDPDLNPNEETPEREKSSKLPKNLEIIYNIEDGMLLIILISSRMNLQLPLTFRYKETDTGQQW